MRQWCMYFERNFIMQLGNIFLLILYLDTGVNSPGRRGPGFCCYGCQVRPGPPQSNNGLQEGQRSAVEYLPAPAPITLLILAILPLTSFPSFSMVPSSWETGPFHCHRRPIETWTSVHLLALELLRICAVQRGWSQSQESLNVALAFTCHPSATAGRRAKVGAESRTTLLPGHEAPGQQLLSDAVWSAGSTALRSGPSAWGINASSVGLLA